MSACGTNKGNRKVANKRLALLNKNAEILKNTKEVCLEYTAKKLGCKLLPKKKKKECLAAIPKKIDTQLIDQCNKSKK